MLMRYPNTQEDSKKKQALNVLETDRVRLLIDYPFVGTILIRQNLIPVVDSRCPSVSTDGQNIFANPEFYLAMSPDARRFILAHIVWHTVFLHFLRRNNRDKELFDMAADMEVNRLLRNEQFKLPRGSLMPLRKWELLNAEEIYEKLKEAKAFPKGTLDAHIEPEQTTKQDKAKEEKLGNTLTKIPLETDAESWQVGKQNKDKKEKLDNAEIIVDLDYQVDFGKNPEETIRRKVVEAAVQYEKQRGALPGDIAKIVDVFRSAKLNWKELLAQFVTSCFGGSRRWLPPNRRYISRNLYLQSRRESKLQAVLAIDTSGSTNNYLPQFASELTNLLNSFGQYELLVICCDAKIQSVQTFTNDTPFDGKTIKFKGGGGTSFIPVFDYLEKNHLDIQLLIYFTDGFGDIPAKPIYPVMWVITHNRKNVIPWGYEIRMQ